MFKTLYVGGLDLKKKIFTEVRSNRFSYLLLTIILAGALFVRVYRVDELLQFYYDQGRDALIIWKLWHEGKPFLIGPITGLRGIFLGPFYYYLIAPFYLLGGGDPSYPAVFLAFLSVYAILVLYLLGVKMHSRKAGLIAAVIASFSYYIYQHSRWLSNPNPILLTSMIFLWSLWEIVSENKKSLPYRQAGKIQTSKLNLWWMIASLMLGLSLQLESASAVFYIPVFLFFIIWQFFRRRFDEKVNLPDKKTIIISFVLFGATLLPQFIFNLRHENLLLNNFIRLLFAEKAFRGITPYILEIRSEYFWSVFSTKLFPGNNNYLVLFVVTSLSAYIFSFTKFKSKVIPLFLIFFLTPIIGYTFFQGNFGNIYDYYMSGYFFPFILLFSIGLAEIWKQRLGFLFVLLFLDYFYLHNIPVIKDHLTSTPKTRPIALEDQLGAVGWVYEEAEEGVKFNVDVYVPPVIPYAYDYLFLWQGTKRCGADLCGKSDDRQNIVYVVIEPETIHLDRWTEWIKRYENSSKVLKEVNFGQVKVQKRMRI